MENERASTLSATRTSYVAAHRRNNNIFRFLLLKRHRAMCRILFLNELPFICFRICVRFTHQLNTDRIGFACRRWIMGVGHMSVSGGHDNDQIMKKEKKIILAKVIRLFLADMFSEQTVDYMSPCDSCYFPMTHTMEIVRVTIFIDHKKCISSESGHRQTVDGLHSSNFKTESDEHRGEPDERSERNYKVLSDGTEGYSITYQDHEHNSIASPSPSH